MGNVESKPSVTGLVDSLTLQYYRSGKTFYDLGELQMAEEYFLKAKDVIAPINNAPDIQQLKSENLFLHLKILGFLIRISIEAMYKHLTDRYIQESDRVLSTAGRLKLFQSPEYFYYLGQTQMFKKDFLESIENLNLCVKKSIELNDNDSLAKAYYSLSLTYYAQGNYQSCLQNLFLMKKIPGILGPYLRGVIHLQLANVYINTHCIREALAEVKYVRLAFQGRPCWNLLPYIFLIEGQIYKSMEQYSRSLYIFNLGLDLLNRKYYQRSYMLFKKEMELLQNSSVDMYIYRTNRLVKEKILGDIDFKHRFVILEILYLLVSSPGRSFSKAELAKLIWKNEYSPRIHDQLVYTSVSRLRKLLAPNENDEQRLYILRNQDGYTINTALNIRIVKESDAQDHFDFNHLNPIASV